MGIFYTNKLNLSTSPIDIQQLSESVLLELYFGDSVVTKLQEQFTKFRSKYIGGNWNPKINYDSDLIKFNRLCEEQFGYYRFCLSVSPMFDYNAFMMNIGYLSEDNIGDTFFNNLKIYKNNKGFYYDKAAKVSAITNIYFGLLSDSKFTDREVFAIILHEIGHSFTYAVLNRDGVIGSGSCLINMIQKVNAAINNNLQKDRNFSNERVEDDIQNPSIISKINNFAKSKFNIKGAIYSISKNVQGMRKNVKHYAYTNEKFADTFASMYGYSSELQVGLQKLTDIYRDFYKNPNKKVPGDLSVIIQVGLMSVNNMLGFLLNVKDEHPDGLTRIKVQIEYLEKELRNINLDPKMKMDLQKHLATQMQIVKDFIDSSKDPDVYKAYNVYYTKLYEKYGGDIREKYTDNEAIFNTIDQRYKDISKNESAINELFSLENDHDNAETVQKIIKIVEDHSATNGLKRVMDVYFYPIDNIIIQSADENKQCVIGSITNDDGSEIKDSFHAYAADLNAGLEGNGYDDWKICIVNSNIHKRKMMLILLSQKTTS